jgi:hypothetical protein
VSASAPALIAAAAGVGLGHAILPDHWVPLGVISRTERYPLRRVARLAGLAGVAHVLVSLVLGAVVIAVGLQLRSAVEHAQDAIVGGLLIATGVGFAVLEAAGRGHGHSHAQGDDGHGDQPGHAHHHHHGHAHHHEAPTHSRGAIIASFGAAASPDLTILPVFLAAAAAGAGAAVLSLVVFAAVTIGTIVGLTMLAAVAGYGAQSAWLQRWGNLFTAVVLIAVGALVLTGTV